MSDADTSTSVRTPSSSQRHRCPPLFPGAIEGTSATPAAALDRNSESFTVPHSLSTPATPQSQIFRLGSLAFSPAPTDISALDLGVSVRLSREFNDRDSDDEDEKNEDKKEREMDVQMEVDEKSSSDTILHRCCCSRGHDSDMDDEKDDSDSFSDVSMSDNIDLLESVTSRMRSYLVSFATGASVLVVDGSLQSVRQLLQTDADERVAAALASPLVSLTCLSRRLSTQSETEDKFATQTSSLPTIRGGADSIPRIILTRYTAWWQHEQQRAHRREQQLHQQLHMSMCHNESNPLLGAMEGSPLVSSAADDETRVVPFWRTYEELLSFSTLELSAQQPQPIRNVRRDSVPSVMVPVCYVPSSASSAGVHSSVPSPLPHWRLPLPHLHLSRETSITDESINSTSIPTPTPAEVAEGRLAVPFGPSSHARARPHTPLHSSPPFHSPITTVSQPTCPRLPRLSERQQLSIATTTALTSQSAGAIPSRIVTADHSTTDSSDSSDDADAVSIPMSLPRFLGPSRVAALSSTEEVEGSGSRGRGRRSSSMRHSSNALPSWPAITTFSMPRESSLSFLSQNTPVQRNTPSPVFVRHSADSPLLLVKTQANDFPRARTPEGSQEGDGFAGGGGATCVSLNHFTAVMTVESDVHGGALPILNFTTPSPPNAAALTSLHPIDEHSCKESTPQDRPHITSVHHSAPSPPLQSGRSAFSTIDASGYRHAMGTRRRSPPPQAVGSPFVPGRTPPPISPALGAYTRQRQREGSSSTSVSSASLLLRVLGVTGNRRRRGSFEPTVVVSGARSGSSCVSSRAASPDNNMPTPAGSMDRIGTPAAWTGRPPITRALLPTPKRPLVPLTPVPSRPPSSLLPSTQCTVAVAAAGSSVSSPLIDSGQSAGSPSALQLPGALSEEASASVQGRSPAEWSANGLSSIDLD